MVFLIDQVVKCDDNLLIQYPFSTPSFPGAFFLQILSGVSQLLPVLMPTSSPGQRHSTVYLEAFKPRPHSLGHRDNPVSTVGGASRVDGERCQVTNAILISKTDYPFGNKGYGMDSQSGDHVGFYLFQIFRQVSRWNLDDIPPEEYVKVVSFYGKNTWNLDA
jgi:hypothetical protein